MNDNNEDKPLFEIDDYVYRNQYIFFVMLGIVGIFLSILELFPEKTYSNITLRLLGIYLLGRGITSLYIYYINKNKKVMFYQKKISRNNCFIDVELKDIKEIYKISYFYFLFLTGVKKIHRLNFLAKIVLMVFSITILPLFLLMYLFNVLKYKKFYKQDILILIGEKDKDYIYFEIPIFNNKEKKIEKYLMENFNIDIHTLKTHWFIPKKG